VTGLALMALLLTTPAQVEVRSQHQMVSADGKTWRWVRPGVPLSLDVKRVGKQRLAVEVIRLGTPGTEAASEQVEVRIGKKRQRIQVKQKLQGSRPVPGQGSLRMSYSVRHRFRVPAAKTPVVITASAKASPFGILVRASMRQPKATADEGGLALAPLGGLPPAEKADKPKKRKRRRAKRGRGGKKQGAPPASTDARPSREDGKPATPPSPAAGALTPAPADATTAKPSATEGKPEVAPAPPPQTKPRPAERVEPSTAPPPPPPPPPEAAPPVGKPGPAERVEPNTAPPPPPPPEATPPASKPGLAERVEPNTAPPPPPPPPPPAEAAPPADDGREGRQGRDERQGRDDAAVPPPAAPAPEPTVEHRPERPTAPPPPPVDAPTESVEVIELVPEEPRALLGPRQLGTGVPLLVEAQLSPGLIVQPFGGLSNLATSGGLRLLVGVNMGFFSRFTYGVGVDVDVQAASTRPGSTLAAVRWQTGQMRLRLEGAFDVLRLNIGDLGVLHLGVLGGAGAILGSHWLSQGTDVLAYPLVGPTVRLGLTGGFTVGPGAVTLSLPVDWSYGFGAVTGYAPLAGTFFVGYRLEL
jgi:hypothetical protein